MEPQAGGGGLSSRRLLGHGSAAGIAADDGQNLAGYVARAAWCGEEDEGRRYLFGLGGPFHRGLAAELRNSLRRLVGWIERRPDRPRRDGVHADAALNEMRGERAREGMDAALRHRVVEKILVAEETGDGTCHDDGAAVLHFRDGRFCHVEVAVQIRLDGAVEVFLCQ